MRLAWVAPFSFLVAACGSASPHPHGPSLTGAIEPASFLLQIGGERTQLLAPETRTIDQLETARRDAHGADRRTALRDLARAHLFAAETSTGREQRRHRSEAMRNADQAASGSHDDNLAAEMAFVDLWIMWRSGSPGAPTRAERFTDRYPAAGDLTILAWILRGEIAASAEQWNDATTAFRYALGELGHPTYAYALYRTAQCWHMQGRDTEARQALGEVAQLGCAQDADDATLRVALQADHDLGGRRRTGADGKSRPSSCPRPDENGGATDAAANRDIDHERPPGD